MKTAVLYTVLSVLDLVGFAVGIGFLPAQVPIHFNASMTADAIGSPWVYVALPGASALISAGFWASLAQKKNRAVTVGILAALGILFATIGWAFFALIASGVELGESAVFPVELVVLLPLSLLFVWVGNYMPRIEPNRAVGIRTGATLKSEEVWRKTHRLGGRLFFAAGLLSAAAALIFGIVPALGSVRYVAAVAFVVSGVAAAAACVAYAHALGKRAAPPAEEEK